SMVHHASAAARSPGEESDRGHDDEGRVQARRITRPPSTTRPIRANGAPIEIIPTQSHPSLSKDAPVRIAPNNRNVRATPHHFHPARLHRVIHHHVATTAQTDAMIDRTTDVVPPSLAAPAPVASAPSMNPKMPSQAQNELPVVPLSPPVTPPENERPAVAVNSSVFMPPTESTLT